MSRYRRDKKEKRGETNVNVDKLAAVRARNSLLDDGVLGHPLVDGGDAVKREADAHEIEETVHEESARAYR